jgi:hypothetical protein
MTPDFFRDFRGNEVYHITGGRRAIIQALAERHQAPLEGPNVPRDAETALVSYISNTETQVIALNAQGRLTNVWRVRY